MSTREQLDARILQILADGQKHFEQISPLTLNGERVSVRILSGRLHELRRLGQLECDANGWKIVS